MILLWGKDFLPFLLCSGYHFVVSVILFFLVVLLCPFPVQESKISTHESNISLCIALVFAYEYTEHHLKGFGL